MRKIEQKITQLILQETLFKVVTYISWNSWSGNKAFPLPKQGVFLSPQDESFSIRSNWLKPAANNLRSHLFLLGVVANANFISQGRKCFFNCELIERGWTEDFDLVGLVVGTYRVSCFLYRLPHHN